MNVLIIYAHPWEGSFNHAVLESVKKGLESARMAYDVIDLYHDGFNPTFTKAELAVYRKGEYTDPLVGVYQEKITAATHLVFIFPIWWGVFPALLKGFLEKVVLPHWAYERKKSGLFTGKLGFIRKALVMTTAGGPAVHYRLYLRNPLKQILIKDVLKPFGIKKTKLLIFTGIKSSTPGRRRKWLCKMERYARELS
ncbi:MAG TPA: flavodoxin family protein [Spirochaetia bacterium]|nr:flavodoxin family protein [Spirochaetia bacterium]